MRHRVEKLSSNMGVGNREKEPIMERFKIRGKKGYLHKRYDRLQNVVFYSHARKINSHATYTTYDQLKKRLVNFPIIPELKSVIWRVEVLVEYGGW